MTLPNETATFSSCRFNFFDVILIPNSRNMVDGGTVVCFADGTDVVVPSDLFGSLRFDVESSGIVGGDIIKRDITISGKMLHCNESVTLYDAKGQKVAESSTGTLNLSGIPTGVYIVKTENEILKLILK